MQLRRGMEQLSGLSLEGVRVHRNSAEPGKIGAHAYAHGRDIHLGPGGEAHLGHEAWHVVQQAQGRVRPTVQAKGKAINADPTLEAEADRMARRAATLDVDAVTETARPASFGDGSTIQGRFGFEIEVPIFFTTDYGAGDGRRGDPGTIAIDRGTYEVKADHNMDLSPLLTYANQHQNGGVDRFPGGPSIIELVTKPLDEFVATETAVRNLATTMAQWTKTAHTSAVAGDNKLVGNYYVGSDSPQRTLQNTQGYFQATYGIKLSKVPEAFKSTAKAAEASGSTDATSIAQLKSAAKAGPAVVKALKKTRTSHGRRVQEVVPKHDLEMLAGFASLLGNYLIADTRIEGAVGLGKNAIGDFFYKSDLGDVANALPTSVSNLLRGDATVLDAFTTSVAEAVGRTANDKLAVNLTVKQWISRVVNGNADIYLKALKNKYSAELNPEPVGRPGKRETGVIMENREPQNLDTSTAKRKRKEQQREKDEFYSGPKRTKDELLDFLSTMTDPKKYPPDQWEELMVKVYKALRKVNG
ncbi:MAG: DUF4157 domain-containing protein [Pseudomonadota bacterium]